MLVPGHPLGCCLALGRIYRDGVSPCSFPSGLAGSACLLGPALLSLPGYSLPRAAVTKHRILGALKQQDHTPLHSGAQKSDAVSLGQVPGEAGRCPSGAVRETPCRLFPHSWLLACFHLQRRPLWSAYQHPLICPRPMASGPPPAADSSWKHLGITSLTWIGMDCGVLWGAGTP